MLRLAAKVLANRRLHPYVFREWMVGQSNEFAGHRRCGDEFFHETAHPVKLQCFRWG